MLASAIGWALYSIYLFYWKTNLKIFDRFTLIAFFGAVSLLPFYLIEESLRLQKQFLIQNFFMWVFICSHITRNYSLHFVYNGTKEAWCISYRFYTLYIFTVYSAIYGYLFFNEQLEYYHYIGTVLVFGGVYIVKKKV